LTHADVRGLDHDIAYRQLAAGAIDVTDVYTTDAKIRSMDLTLLADDREFFPRYDAVLLFRKDLATRFPDLMPRLALLRNRISVQQMVVLNHQVEIERVPESTVAAEWLHKQFGISVTSSRKTTLQLIGVSTMEHLDLVRKSLIPAIFVGIPMGVVAAKRPVLGSLTLGSVGVIQTIPALALLVILMPVVNKIGGQSLGVGSLTAVLALFLYSLLPIVRNTSSGLANIETQYLESARAMGLSPAFRLWHIELPLALRSILAGIKTAAVINVGFATLGALIGAGGYGQPILTGIRLADTGLILRGAIPAAVLALVVQGIFDILERFVIPRGLNP
jgi:osmoprotectant transport system permease protein